MLGYAHPRLSVGILLGSTTQKISPSLLLRELFTRVPFQYSSVVLSNRLRFAMDE